MCVAVGLRAETCEVFVHAGTVIMQHCVGKSLLAWLMLCGLAAGAEDSRLRDLLRVREPPAEEPWLRINAGGHTAAVQALAFAPDGKRLCSAGLDKVVQVWNLTAVTRDLRRTFLRERVLRWQVARGLRGAIYALAAAPDDGLLALGGYGAMGSLGEILLVDPVEGTLARVLNRHRQTICGLAFSADGKWLASADVAGEVTLWNRDGWRPHTVYAPDDETYGAELAALIRDQPKVRPLTIAGNRALIAPVCVGQQSDGRLGWQLQQIKLQAPQDAHPLPAIHSGLATALAASADGALLASADMAGKLYLWDLTRGILRGELTPEATVIALAFSPDGRTLVAGTAVVPSRGQSQIQVWDVPSRTVRERRSLPDHVRACSVSPDGRRFAYTGAKDNEVFVASLADPQQVTVLGGTGRRILKAAFAAAAPFYRVAWGTQFRAHGFNDAAELQESFDLTRLSLEAAPPEPSAWIAADWGRGDWRAEPQPDGGLQLHQGKSARARVALDPALEGKARSFCWIADDKGAPQAIAVGTDVQNGVYVYRLAQEGTCPLLRHFRGHSDYVTSVGVSHDRQHLVSGSADGALMLWSLAEHEQGTAPVGRWGIDFTATEQVLTAKTVHPAGPLFFKGVRAGDVLTAIRWSQRGAIHVAKQPAAIRQRLQDLAWMTQVTFEFQRAGRARLVFQLLPAWQPLATLFVDSRREWAYWTPAGYYDASANGYTLFGWQVNRGLDLLPDFYRADQFRKRLERPDVLEHLLPAGSLEEAFRRTAQAPPAESHAVLPTQIAMAPRVEILAPRPGTLVQDDHTLVRARILLPAPTRLTQARVYANGVVAVRQRQREEQALPQGRLVTCAWDVPLTADQANLIQLIVGTDEQATALGDVLVARPAQLRAPRPPRLYIVAVGVNKYADPAIQPLAFAVADAQAVLQTLPEKSRGLYSVERAVLLTGEQATPKAWRAALESMAPQLREQARPDDLLVLFFAGHGILKPADGTYYFVGHHAQSEQLFADRFDDCISWRDFRMLSDIPCRKLVLLDSCHSGAIQPLRARDLTAAIRTLQEDVIFTLSASAGSEPSAEDKRWQHGAFTKCLLAALDGAGAAPPERVVTLNALAQYVQQSVSQLTAGRQNPVAAPDDLLPVVTLPLAVPPHAAGGR